MLSPPPTRSHRMKIDVARPSPCPSSLPPAGVAVAVAVTSRPLRLGKRGGGEGGEGKPGKYEQRLRKSRRLPSDRKSAAPPTSPGNHFLGLVFSAGCHLECLFSGTILVISEPIGK